ncbi:hypothetical protein Pryu01_01905 [Paraliobacillus ryukyuensis]|uniref:Uncharacterized protein n=2 Tax=Paraliobacillus ryukyuensis TaxID=200904 RepID=A0A366DYL4_9BACI|nr:hypothetical protein DES48_1098 [Paraliobacillus ryukyuensis]
MIADKPVVDETTTQPVDEHFSEFNGYETIKEAKAAGYSMAITSDHWFVFDLCLTDLN